VDAAIAEWLRHIGQNCQEAVSVVTEAETTLTISPFFVIAALSLCLASFPDVAVILARIAATVELEESVLIVCAAIGARRTPSSIHNPCSDTTAWLAAAIVAVARLLTDVATRAPDIRSWAATCSEPEKDKRLARVLCLVSSQRTRD
jgi:hypothetical protein